LIIDIFLLVGGLILLVAGAELLVRAASVLAESFGIPKLIIGLTVVAFGTSAPELAISIQSAHGGYPGILLGNVVGSNIANILLIFGIAALILPIKVTSKIIRIDVPVMIFCGLLMFVFSLNGVIGLIDALVLITVLIVYLYMLTNEARHSMQQQNEKNKGVNRIKESVLLIVGLIMLIYGADLMVASAVSIAESFGMSELIIGLTIVAIGTSLPEIAAAIAAMLIAAMLRNEPEMVVGNVLGSNILNILVVIGITGLFYPGVIEVQEQALRFDIPIMLVTFFACLPIFFTGFKISRWEGILFLGYYCIYIIFLILYATEHMAYEYLKTGMLFFVLPLTFITLFVIAYRQKIKKRKFHKPK